MGFQRFFMLFPCFSHSASDKFTLHGYRRVSELQTFLQPNSLVVIFGCNPRFHGRFPSATPFRSPDPSHAGNVLQVGATTKPNRKNLQSFDPSEVSQSMQGFDFVGRLCDNLCVKLLDDLEVVS